MKKILSFTAIILALSAPVSFAADDMDKTDYQTLKSSPNARKSSYDIQFLDTMIAHHRQGVQMAQMAQDKSQNEEVKDKAKMMVDDQKSDISNMKTIRDDIQEKAPEAVNMDMEGMASVDLKTLNSQSAKKFDEKFLKMSIKHREGGKEMSKDAMKRAKNSKVKELASSLTGKQMGEIVELKEMQKKLND